MVSTAEAKGRAGQVGGLGAWSYVNQMNPMLIDSYGPGIS